MYFGEAPKESLRPFGYEAIFVNHNKEAQSASEGEIIFFLNEWDSNDLLEAYPLFGESSYSPEEAQ